MPYIDPIDRKRVDKELNKLKFGTRLTAGELTYVVTRLLLDFVKSDEKPGFVHLALGLGVLDATRLEFYRRVVAGYENKKCLDHGDVYPESYP